MLKHNYTRNWLIQNQTAAARRESEGIISATYISLSLSKLINFDLIWFWFATLKCVHAFARASLRHIELAMLAAQQIYNCRANFKLPTVRPPWLSGPLRVVWCLVMTPLLQNVLQNIHPLHYIVRYTQFRLNTLPGLYSTFLRYHWIWAAGFASDTTQVSVSSWLSRTSTLALFV